MGGFDLITPLGIADGDKGGPTPHFRKYEGAVCPPDYRSPERRRPAAVGAGALPRLLLVGGVDRVRVLASERGHGGTGPGASDEGARTDEE